MRKVSQPLRCFVCGGETTDEAIGQYVEVEITFPDFGGPMRQFFGGHVACVNRIAAPGFVVESPEFD